MGNATCFKEQNIPIFLGQPFHRVTKGCECGVPLRDASDQIKRIGDQCHFKMDKELVEFWQGNYRGWVDESQYFPKCYGRSKRLVSVQDEKFTVAHKSQHVYQRICRWYSRQQDNSVFGTLKVTSTSFDGIKGKHPTKRCGTNGTTSKVCPRGKWSARRLAEEAVVEGLGSVPLKFRMRIEENRRGTKGT